MHPIRLLCGLATVCVAAASVSPAAGQAGAPPTISARSFTGGSAAVTVTGTVEFTQDIALNTQASFGDGEKTWIQFGASGAETPNALLTYGDGEVGVSVGRGKFVATAGIMEGDTPQCSGSAEVTGAMVSGHYTCPGIVSYDARTGKMGKVNIDVRFTAKS